MNNSNLKMNYDDFGEMRSANNTVVKEFQKGNYDYISIDELLSAAGKWKQQNLCFPPLLPSTFPILLLLLKLSSRTLLRCPPPCTRDFPRFHSTFIHAEVCHLC